MADCTCPDDGQKVPAARRVVLFEPGAVIRDGSTTARDPSRVHIYHADCPVHGYRVISEEGDPHDRAVEPY